MDLLNASGLPARLLTGNGNYYDSFAQSYQLTLIPSGSFLSSKVRLTSDTVLLEGDGETLFAFLPSPQLYLRHTSGGDTALTEDEFFAALARYGIDNSLTASTVEGQITMGRRRGWKPVIICDHGNAHSILSFEGLITIEYPGVRHSQTVTFSLRSPHDEFTLSYQTDSLFDPLELTVRASGEPYPISLYAVLSNTEKIIRIIPAHHRYLVMVDGTDRVILDRQEFNRVTETLEGLISFLEAIVS